MDKQGRSIGWAVALVVGGLGALAADAPAQDYLFTHRWRVDGAGVPVAAARSLDLRQAGTLAPELRFGVFVGAFPWNTITYTVTAGPGGPLWTSGVATSVNGTPGCSSYTNASGCLDLGTPNVGVYTIRAAASGGGVGFANIVVGGGSPVAVAGPQAFRLGGMSSGAAFTWDVTLAGAQPIMAPAALTPGLDGAGIAAELAAMIDAEPLFTAVAAGPVLTIDTAPPGGAFRFWIDDFQVTGGGGTFNPDIDDVTVKALPVDRQPGRNFPVATAEFGTGRSENIDVGDADNDGDLDVIVANGGDGAAQLDRIYINQGGVQGGAQGSFVDETAARFSGFVAAKSRDIEFADTDGDFDLDVFAAIYGTIPVGGAVSRFYRNQGGLQGGSVGFYLEDTNLAWGDLVSVALGQQVFGGNQGPWRGFTCDCDFGDLDLDGDVDLFHAGYGPEINGSSPSRVFLNDGTGRFDELWPWADAGADIATHTLDIDLVDLDGDFDLDVFNSSRDSQARVYRNDLDAASMGWSGDPFVDVTQTALLDTLAGQGGSVNYEAEPGDLDGDGDFDLWCVNYAGFSDRILRNDGGMQFTMVSGWIKGDPSVDEHEVDFLDYDGDGDLDASMASFSGKNQLYLNGLADGLDHEAVGLMHRTGTSSAGSLAPWHEAPASSSGISLDTDAADMDGDGDPDIVIANDGNGLNRYWENELGIPDTHAPTLALLTIQGDKSDGSDTVIRAQLRDNAAHYVINLYDVDLVYTVDGGFPNRVAMHSQGGQAFQGVIPGGIHGVISYRVEGHDLGLNMFTSEPVSYVQTSSGVTLIETVGEGTPGVYQRPRLDLSGTLLGGSDLSVTLRSAAPSGLAGLFLSLSSTALPFKGGLLHTVPVLDVLYLATNGGGELHLDLVWPAGLPAGVSLWTQFGIADPDALKGATLSNAAKLTTP